MSSTTDQPGTQIPSEQPPRGSRVGRALAILAGIVLVLIGLTALVWNLARSEDTVSDSFTGDIDRVIISVNGRVDLTAGDEAAAQVEREWILREPDVIMEVEGGTLRIEADCSGFADFGCMTHVEATAPAGAEVAVETAAGNVNVSGFQQGVDLTTSAGNIEVLGLVGPANLRSSAGRIVGDVTDGNVDARTSAGRIELDVSGEFSSLSAVTSAGNVVLTVPDVTYRVDADTSAGNVTLDVATDPDADRVIYARSSAGSITVQRR